MSAVTSSTAADRGSRADWLLFVLLGFVWGSSYLFIKIAVDAGLQPFTLIMLRLLVGFALLVTVAVATRQTLPRAARPYFHLAVMGFVNILLPFSLITWAEGTVDSSLAAILNSPVPLFVVIIAAIVLQDERLTPTKLAGVAIGLLGVAFVVGFDPATLASAELPAELALIGSAISYAIGAVYARRFVRGLPPMIPAVFQVGYALLMSGVLAFLFENPLAAPMTSPRSARSSGWGCSALVWRICCSSGCSAVGARAARRWWLTCCRCGASRSASWYLVSRSAPPSSSVPCWSSSASPS